MKPLILFSVSELVLVLLEVLVLGGADKRLSEYLDEVRLMPERSDKVEKLFLVTVVANSSSILSEFLFWSDFLQQFNLHFLSKILRNDVFRRLYRIGLAEKWILVKQMHHYTAPAETEIKIYFR